MHQTRVYSESPWVFCFTLLLLPEGLSCHQCCLGPGGLRELADNSGVCLSGCLRVWCILMHALSSLGVLVFKFSCILYRQQMEALCAAGIICHEMGLLLRRHESN